METPPDEITTSQASKAADRNDRSDSLSSWITSFIIIFAPAFSVNSAKTYKFELKIWPCPNFPPGSTSSLPVPKIATRGFFDTLAFP